MARDLPIGNGNVLVNFDKHYNLRDIYYPHVGQENHALDHLSHFGIWTPEGFFWIDAPEVKIMRAEYLQDSLVTDVECVHERLGVKLNIRDGIDVKENIMVRKVKVNNMFDRERTIKLYFHLDLHLYGNVIGDTVYFDPDLRSLVFYKGHRYLSLSCSVEEAVYTSPSSYATGQKEIHGLEGTWRDAEDGKLGRNSIAQGAVDGTIEMELKTAAHGTIEGWFWVCFGTSVSEIKRLENDIRTKGTQTLLQRTHDYWVQWLGRDKHELSALEPDIAAFYKRSLLIIRTNMDNRGAIIAANDSDILKFAKDTYSYMWPRDGALITHALDRAGYHDLTRRFFEFCRKSLTEYGFLLHKYNPDGSVGSSWHPWINGQGNKQLPIQEDETALVVYTLWHNRLLSETLEQSRDEYDQFVIPAADFLVRYRDASGLPLPSYDLWEERYGVFAFTVSSVFAGLLAASNFAEYHKDKARSLYYRETAEHVRRAAENYLYSNQEQRFIRALYWNEQNLTYEPDMLLDASMYALFDFEMFAADDPRIVRTMEAIKQKLWVQTEVGGMARYSDDYYHQISRDTGKVPGNPWFICTLWYAEWLIAVSGKESDLQPAAELLRWVMHHSLPSGVLAEQIHPYTGEPLSVSPLTWSHASFIKVTQEYLSKLKLYRTGNMKAKQDVSDKKLLKEVVQKVHS